MLLRLLTLVQLWPCCFWSCYCRHHSPRLLSALLLAAGELKAQSIIDWIKQQAGLGKSAGNSSGGGGSSSKPGGKGDARPQKGGQQETQQEKKREEQGEEKEEKGQQPPATPSILQNVTAGQLAAELEKEGVVVLTFFAEAPSSSSGAGGGGDGASAEDSGAAAAVGCGALLQAVNKAVFELAQLAKGIQVGAGVGVGSSPKGVQAAAGVEVGDSRFRGVLPASGGGWPWMRVLCCGDRRG